jgi:MFS family permease
MLLGIVGWIVIGSIIGFIVSKILDLHGDDPRLGIGVAVGAAIVFAAVYTMISGAGVSAWNPWSMLFAAIGAGAGLAVWHGVRSRYVSRARQTHRRSY